MPASPAAAAADAVNRILGPSSPISREMFDRSGLYIVRLHSGRECALVEADIIALDLIDGVYSRVRWVDVIDGAKSCPSAAVWCGHWLVILIPND